MKRKLLLLILIFSFSNTIFSQIEKKELKNEKSTFLKNIEEARRKSPNGIVRCASHEYHSAKQSNKKAIDEETFEKWLAPKVQEIKKLREARMLPSVIRIPVVVHVIHNGDAVGTNENIADAQVLAQITVLNQDFRRMTGTPGAGPGVDTTIEFCMATVDPNGNPTNGIDRRNLGLAFLNEADVENTMKPTTIWDPTKYFNMWTANFAGGDLDGVLGYAQFPSGSGLAGMPAADCVTGEASTDGFICAYGTFGCRAIFPGGTYSDTQYDQGRTATHEIGHMFGLRHIWGDKTDCSGDDYCADVPPCSADYYSAEATCVNPSQCGFTRQIENYMDYSDDLCMDRFTQNQKDRMLAVLQNSPRRDDLLVSPVCNAPTSSIQFKRIDCSTRIMNIDVNEGSNNTCNGYTEYTVPLSINKAPTQNAVVTFAIDGTSTANAADISIQTPTVTFPTGVTTDRNLVFRVLNDAIIEPTEDLIISFTVNANGGDATAHAEGNKLKVTILNNNDVASATSYTNTLINEDFEDAASWTLLDADGDARQWGLINGVEGLVTNIVGACAYSEKSRTYLGGTGSATPNNYLISPQVTIPTGASAITLQYHMGAYGATAGNYTVYFATNISSATNINAGTVLQAASTQTAGTSVLRSHSLAALAGQTGYIVFRHSNLNTATGLLVLDNVNLSATMTTQVQTAVNTGTQFNSNIPSNGNFVAFDNVSTYNIIADITSNTNFNYGCTTVAVTRDQATAGAAAVNYGSNTANNLKVMAKRITVTPTNPNTSASGTVKFYFTEAEIAAWETATGNLRSALRIIKDGVATTLATTLATFGTHTSLQANVTDGIGGVYYFGTVATLSNQAFEFESFGLYPNPNNGSFNVTLNSDSSKISVKVFDIRGREIFNNNYSNSGIFNQTIQLNNIQKGVYLVNITDGSRKTTRRIVIE